MYHFITPVSSGKCDDICGIGAGSEAEDKAKGRRLVVCEPGCSGHCVVALSWTLKYPFSILDSQEPSPGEVNVQSPAKIDCKVVRLKHFICAHVTNVDETRPCREKGAHAPGNAECMDVVCGKEVCAPRGRKGRPAPRVATLTHNVGRSVRVACLNCIVSVHPISEACEETTRRYEVRREAQGDSARRTPNLGGFYLSMVVPERPSPFGEQLPSLRRALRGCSTRAESGGESSSKK